MTYLYLKALHIIFVVTWFAALFYMPRLFIYNTEALQKDNAAREVLQSQFQIMMKRLWYGIAWPSAIISLILGKIAGILGVILGFSFGITRMIGGGLLVLAILLIVNCIIFCVLEMKQNNKINKEEDLLKSNLYKLQNTLRMTKLELEGLRAKKDLVKFMSKM